MNRINKALNIAAVLAALFAGAAAADSWLPPTEADYYSANEAYYVHVVPGNASKPAQGTLYEAARREGDDVEVWSRWLENPYAPHKVLVADSGEYVVTFDEWGRVGYGPHVVVIYGPEGDVVKSFALEDLLTEEEIEAVPCTVSSRWWGGAHYLDEEAGELVLVIGRETEPGAVTAPGREIRIRLSDGEVLP